jgi:hypothetical protein
MAIFSGTRFLPVIALALLVGLAADAGQLDDLDGDGVIDGEDNCLLVPNGPSAGVGPSQYDADGDGFGNICDADLNGDGLVSGIDASLMLPEICCAVPVPDLNGDGIVSGADWSILGAAFNSPPGPSALATPPALDYSPTQEPIPIALAATGDVHVRYVIDEAITDGIVHGNLVTGLASGDRVTVQVEVENASGGDVQILFATTVFDPTALIYVGGEAERRILKEPGFGTPELLALAPWDIQLTVPAELRYGRDDVVVSLFHGTAGSPTEARGPEIVSTLEFEVTTSGPWAGTIGHRLSPFDTSLISVQQYESRQVVFGPNLILSVPEPGFAAGLFISAGLLATSRPRRPAIHRA